ncbi:MAG: hypothetical protein JNL70_02395, partial [Saprospiraceae bacterium]|nr:hypothetical protein [Saprospiraceae bacterium]
MNKRIIRFYATLIFFYTTTALTAQWTQKANFGGGTRVSSAGFSIGTKCYIGTGYDSNFNPKNDFWEYDPSTNVWTQKANYGGGVYREAVGFAIGTKGYIGMGANATVGTNDFWEYDPSTNIWTKKANFGGGSRSLASSFVIGSKGYVGGGLDANYVYKNDFWEYDPSTNVWTQKANLTTTPRLSPVSFAIGTKGYMGSGYASSGFLNDFWEYDPSTNVWTQKTNFGGTGRYQAACFALGTKGYVATGYDNNSVTNDFWEYDPSTNAWTQKTNYGGGARYGSVGFNIGTKGYVGTGFNGAATQNDFWEYSVPCTTPTAYTVTGGGTSCAGATVAIGLSNSETGVTYQLVRGGSTNVGAAVTGTGSAIAFTAQSTAGTYTVVATRTAGGCTATMTGSATVTASSVTPSVSVVASPSNIVATGTNVTFTATPTNGGTTPQYQWKKNNNNVGTNSSTYTDAALANNDAITCVMTSNAACASPTTATSTAITMSVNPAGAALNFDGTNDYILLPNSLGSALTSSSNMAITIEYWFKGSNVQSAVRFQDNSNSGNYIAPGVLISGVYKHVISTDGGTAGLNMGSNLMDGNWHHVAMVWQKNTVNGFRSYLDGVLVDQRNSANANLPTIGSGISIGAYSTGSTVLQFTNGVIDEVRLWSRALSQCELQNNMSCELGSGQTGLVAYYKFNQGISASSNTSITSLTDASGNANTGTLNNFALTGTTSNWIATGGVITGTTCTTYAPSYTWTGTTSTDWATATNWSCGVVPTSTSSVTIPTTTNQPALAANQTISNLTLSGSNKIVLGSSNLTVNSITGGSSTAYIVTNGTGSLTIKALPTNTATNFPIGVSETSYDPLSIQPTSSVDFTAKVKSTTVSSDFTGNISNFNKVAKRQWDITPANTPGATVVSLTNGGTTFTPTKARIGHYKTTTSSWEELAATFLSNTWTVTTSNFSPFGVGDEGGFVEVVLPVELTSFTGKYIEVRNPATGDTEGGNLLTWTTANETNNNGFEVERLKQSTVSSQQSTGDVWETLGFVAAKGKSATYTFVDNLTSARFETSPTFLTYYRLRQIDNDGTETLSKAIAIQVQGSKDKLKAYPSVTHSILTIETDA